MHVIVVGCGRVGSSVALTLSSAGHDVVVVDRKADAFRRLGDHFVGTTLVGVGFDRDVLTSAGITPESSVAAVTSGDNSNILIARVARETFGVAHVVARIYDPRRASIYQRLGIATVATVSWASERVLRFLTDSETLNKILKITMATQGPVDGAALAEAKFPASETIGQVVELCASGSIDQASQLLADISGVSPETALRILSDRDGEPIAVIMKAMGYTRALFGEALERLQKSDYQLLRADRKLAELQSIFDSLSFNKARILLTGAA